MWHGLMPVLPQWVSLIFILFMGKQWTQYIDFLIWKIKVIAHVAFWVGSFSLHFNYQQRELDKIFVIHIYHNAHCLYECILEHSLTSHLEALGSVFDVGSVVPLAPLILREARWKKKGTSYLWNVHYHTNLIFGWLYFYYSWKAEPHK